MKQDKRDPLYRMFTGGQLAVAFEYHAAIDSLTATIPGTCLAGDGETFAEALRALADEIDGGSA